MKLNRISTPAAGNGPAAAPAADIDADIKALEDKLAGWIAAANQSGELRIAISSLKTAVEFAGAHLARK